MTPDEKMRALSEVALFANIEENILRELAEDAIPCAFLPAQRMVTELEFGADVRVIVRGEAEVSVISPRGKRELLGRVGPGALVGEMASLTGELRSATVTAVTAVEALLISDSVFDRLRARRPEIALSLVRTMASRIDATERTLTQLLQKEGDGSEALAEQVAGGALRSLWRELVVRHKRDIPFVMMASFAWGLLLVRAVVYLSFTYDLAPREVVRMAYVTGFSLVMLSAAASLLTFRPTLRPKIAVAFGLGLALIVNELGVTLAFDIFYKDIFTPDPAHPFNIEQLYRRTEPLRATLVVLAVLLQAVYLRRLYFRLWELVHLRLIRKRRSGEGE